MHRLVEKYISDIVVGDVIPFKGSVEVIYESETGRTFITTLGGKLFYPIGTKLNVFTETEGQSLSKADLWKSIADKINTGFYTDDGDEYE